MGEILPNGEMQGYFGYCPKCGAEISVNIQGTPRDNHVCAAPQNTKEQNEHIAQHGQAKT